MNKEKQIDEMARDINIADHEYCNGQCIGCEHKPKRIEDCACIDIAIATGLTAKGYRKASEVAEEIIAVLRTAGITEARYPVIAKLKMKYKGDTK